MGGFHKSKGIVIELTALLDVIMIMLFWVMLNVQDSSEQTKAEAQQQVAEIQQELDAVKTESDAEIARIWQKAEDINKEATANQQALIGYEQGMLVTLNIKYDTDGMLYVSDYQEQLGKASMDSQQEIYNMIVSSIEKAGLKQDDVILCALVYDSKNSLYKHVTKVKKAVEDVRNVYGSLYCTYIDTSK